MPVNEVSIKIKIKSSYALSSDDRMLILNEIREALRDVNVLEGMKVVAFRDLSNDEINKEVLGNK